MTYQPRPHSQPFEFYSEFENAEHSPMTAFEWPGEMEFETAQPAGRKSSGTDCRRSGSSAALVTRPGGRYIGPTPRVCPSVAGILLVVSNTVLGRIALLKRDIAGNPPYTADRPPFNPQFMHIQIAKRA
jgi:hypothetical protein